MTRGRIVRLPTRSLRAPPPRSAALPPGRPAALALRTRPVRLMFDQRAFQTWVHVFVGALLFSGAFLAVMLLARPVVGTDPTFHRATVVISMAAFAGYVGTAWLIRRHPPDA